MTKSRREFIKRAAAGAGYALAVPALSSCGGGGSASSSAAAPIATPTTSRALGLAPASAARIAGLAPAAMTTSVAASLSAIAAAPTTSGYSLSSMGAFWDNSPLFGPSWQFLLPPGQTSWISVLPAVGDQSTQGSCTAWSVGYAMASAINNAYLSPPMTDIRSDHAKTASPADLYAKLVALEAVPCGNVTAIADALDILIREGIDSIANVPYSASSCSLASSASTFRLGGYQFLTPATDMAKIKAASRAHLIIPIAIKVYSDFETFTGTGIYSHSATDTSLLLGYHCMVVTGYDDIRQAFLIQNSWGTGWGNGGYVWMDYTTFALIASEAYLPTISASVSPLPLPSAAAVQFAGYTLGWNVCQDSTTGQSHFYCNVGVSQPVQVNSLTVFIPSLSWTFVYNFSHWMIENVFSWPISAALASALTGSTTVQVTLAGTTAAGQSFNITTSGVGTILR